MFKVKRTTRRERKTLARWVARMNAEPENQIGYLGDDPAEVEHALLDDLPVLANSVFLHPGSGAQGFFGFEELVDSDLVLLYGPLVHGDDWDGAADALFEGLQPLLPRRAVRLELFFNEKNPNMPRFAERQGFERGKDVYLQRFTRDSLGDIAAAELPTLGTSDTDALRALHSSMFPNRGDITKDQGEHKKIFLHKRDDDIAGYVSVTVNPKFPEGYIEYVAVNPDFRGLRVGDRLMAAALTWMFSFDHIQETWLSTDKDNLTAQKLYERSGFETIHTMKSARRQHPDT